MVTYIKLQTVQVKLAQIKIGQLLQVGAINIVQYSKD